MHIRSIPFSSSPPQPPPAPDAPSATSGLCLAEDSIEPELSLCGLLFKSGRGLAHMVRFRISFFLTRFLAGTFFVDISGRPLVHRFAQNSRTLAAASACPTTMLYTFLCPYGHSWSRLATDMRGSV